VVAKNKAKYGPFISEEMCEKRKLS
jgi:hypothetical protein